MSSRQRPSPPPCAYIALDAGAIHRRLKVVDIDCAVDVEPSLDSTNSDLLRQLRRDPLACVGSAQVPRLRLLAAEQQTMGRGRHGRSWHGAVGRAITASFARRFNKTVADLSGLSLVCGLALRCALNSAGVQAQLKWPNDVLVDDRKIAGILVEVQALERNHTAAVMGFGINVAPDPERDDKLDHGAVLATDVISAARGRISSAPIDRNEFLTTLATALTAHLTEFEQHGFGAFMARWNAAHAWRDQRVHLLEPGHAPQIFHAREINEQGHLRLETPGGSRWIFSGDLSLRPAA